MFRTVIAVLVLQFSAFAAEDLSNALRGYPEGDEERRALGREFLDRGTIHDGFLLMMVAGEEEDIPLLISRLRDMGDVEPDEGFPCTRAHCIAALDRLFGEDVSHLNAAEWIALYEERSGREFVYVPNRRRREAEEAGPDLPTLTED